MRNLFDAASVRCEGVSENDGFTLLELIIVLVLAGIFMVITIPALRDTLIDDPLKASARRLIGYIDNVREAAVREQQGYLLRIDLDENVIYFASQDELDDKEQTPFIEKKNQFQPKSDVRLRSLWQKDEDMRVGGIVELWVSRQGYMQQTVFHLEDGGRDVISLAVYPFLVQIEVHEGQYEPEADES